MKGITITPRKIISTKDSENTVTGRLIELYKHGNKTEVYLSTLYPHEFKGWHKHTKLKQRFICIKGSLIFILINKDNIREEHALLGTKPEVLEVEPGITIGIRNAGDDEAFLICMPDPMYDPEDLGEKINVIME